MPVAATSNTYLIPPREASCCSRLPPNNIYLLLGRYLGMYGKSSTDKYLLCDLVNPSIGKPRTARSRW